MNYDRGGGRTLRASLLTYNGRSLAPVKLDPSPEDLLETVSDLLRLSSTMTPCAGFREKLHGGQVFANVRKADFFRLLVESWGGDEHDQGEDDVVFRSRKCSFLFSSSEESVDRTQLGGVCLECWTLFVELDNKYCAGRMTSAMIEREEEEELVIKCEPQVEEQQSTKSSRTRRRKRRALGTHNITDGQDQDKNEEETKEQLEVGGFFNKKKNKVNTGKNITRIYILQEHKLKSEDRGESNFESDSSLRRRSGRKRKAANSSLLPPPSQNRNKRGRPPIMLTVPMACDKCARTFTVAKEYRMHRVSNQASSISKTRSNNLILLNLAFPHECLCVPRDWLREAVQDPRRFGHSHAETPGPRAVSVQPLQIGI